MSFPYLQALSEVNKGTSFKIDFIKGDIRVGYRFYLKNFVWEKWLGLAKIDTVPGSKVEELERLYEEYKFSTPSERSERSKPYFYAVPYEELEDEQLMNIQRDVAKFKLEFFVLMNREELYEEMNFSKAYYWQSKKDKDLVVLKKWLSQGEEEC